MRASPRRRSAFHSWFLTHDARTARHPSTTFVNIGCCCSCWCSHHHNNLIYVNFRISSNRPHHLPFSVRPSNQPSSLRACMCSVGLGVSLPNRHPIQLNTCRTVGGTVFFHSRLFMNKQPLSCDARLVFGGIVRRGLFERGEIFRVGIIINEGNVRKNIREIVRGGSSDVWLVGPRRPVKEVNLYSALL